MRLIEKYNDKLALVYDEATQKDWKAPKEFFRIIKKHIKTNQTVLDLGVGTGQTIEPFVKMGCKVYGIDISSKMLELAKKRYKRLNIIKLDLDRNWSMIDKHKFDLVSAIGVLEFVKNLPKVFKKVKKVLNSQGKFCFTFEEYLKDHDIQKFRISEIGRISQKEKVPLILQSKVYRHTLKEIKEMLIECGLNIIVQKGFIAYHRKGNIPVYYRIVLAEHKK